MRVLALVPARGGSKRLPGKNIRKLGGKPLIVWSINAAKGIPEICDILVSTDDLEIADIAQKAGGLVPWLRPNELSTDVASSIDVALHAIDWYENTHGSIDGLMLLQPTSPFRTEATLIRAIDLFGSNDHRPVISVSPVVTHPAWCYRIEENVLSPLSCKDLGGEYNRSQDLPPVYSLNGAMYLVSPEYLLEKGAFFVDEDASPLVMDNPVEALDIDTSYDFMLAEHIIINGLNGD